MFVEFKILYKILKNQVIKRDSTQFYVSLFCRVKEKKPEKSDFKKKNNTSTAL